jgi:hypothetical protein
VFEGAIHTGEGPGLYVEKFGLSTDLEDVRAGYACTLVRFVAIASSQDEAADLIRASESYKNKEVLLAASDVGPRKSVNDVFAFAFEKPSQPGRLRNYCMSN